MSNQYSKKSSAPGPKKMADGGSVGLWDRLKAGNVDQEGSKAYNTWGKGAVDQSAAETSRLSRQAEPAPAATPTEFKRSLPTGADADKEMHEAEGAADNQSAAETARLARQAAPKAAAPKARPKARPKAKFDPHTRVGTEKGRATTGKTASSDQSAAETKRLSRGSDPYADLTVSAVARRAGRAISDFFGSKAPVASSAGPAKGSMYDEGMANGGVVGGNKYGKK